jgi:T-complex protein 1 subunit delta
LVAQTVILSDGSKVFHIDVENPSTSNILIRGSSHLVMEEAERSLHDALCVLRSLVKNRKLVAGGGAIEIEVSKQLENFAQTQRDIMGKVIEKYAEALEVIPYILASNCGLNPIKIVTEIRAKHQHGLKYSGLKARTGQLVDNCLEHKIM